jgi:hypothetical protein
MSVRETSSSGMRPAPSPKAVLMTAIIIVFGILHVIGAVLLHDATTAPPIEASRLVTNGD